MQKAKLLSLGLKDVARLIERATASAHIDDPTKLGTQVAVGRESLIVFILNDPETSDISKSIASACRTHSLHHYILPKFLK